MDMVKNTSTSLAATWEAKWEFCIWDLGGGFLLCGMLTRGPVTFYEPMLARLVQELPEGPEWQYEVKWDGYRVQVIKEGTAVRVLSRRGKDFTTRFADVARAVRKLKAE